MTSSETKILEILRTAATAVAESLDGLEDWGPSGNRSGQYTHDVVADAAALAVLTAAGMGVLSEESGLTDPDSDLLVVLDPVDGSTNASLGLPWWATSLCVLDAEGALAAVVVNQASGVTYEAVRGAGARRDGTPIAPSGRHALGESIVGFTGYPRTHLGWNQYRALGAAALDLCAVAQGSLDAYADCTWGSLGPWDYMGGLLVCTEAGATIADPTGRELVVRAVGERRAPVAAATPELYAQLSTALESSRRL